MGTDVELNLKKRRSILFLLSLCVILFMLSCDNGNQRGSLSTARRKPERMISLAPNITEILFSLGAGERIVGVTNFCTYPPESLVKRKVGGFTNPNPEVIISLRPDLILATPNVGNREAVVWLKDHSKIPILLLKTENLSDLYDAIREIGEVIQEDEKASALVDGIRSEIQSTEKLARSLARKKVLLSLSVEPVIAASPNSYPGALVALAGGDLVPFNTRHDQNATPYPLVSMEEIIYSDPDIIIQTTMDSGDQSGEELLKAFWKRWSSISAVRHGRIFVISGDTILRPSPRAPEGLKLLYKLIHK